MLYEMLAGNPPHTGSSAQQIIMKIITEQPAAVTQYRKSVPPNVAAAVAKALEKLPADRFDSAAKLAEALGNPRSRITPEYRGRRTRSALGTPGIELPSAWRRSPRFSRSSLARRRCRTADAAGSR
jgi:serine/threonine protein kinase